MSKDNIQKQTEYIKSLFNRPSYTTDPKLYLGITSKLISLERHIEFRGIEKTEDFVSLTLNIYQGNKDIDPRLSTIISSISNFLGCVLVWTKGFDIPSFKPYNTVFIYGRKGNAEICDFVLKVIIGSLYNARDKKREYYRDLNKKARAKGKQPKEDARILAQGFYEMQVECLERNIPDDIMGVYKSFNIEKELEIKILEYAKLDFNMFHRYFNPKLKHAFARKGKFQINKIVR